MSIEKAINFFETQSELAKVAGVSQQSVSKWLTKKSKPSIAAAKRIHLHTNGVINIKDLRPDIYDGTEL